MPILAVWYNRYMSLRPDLVIIGGGLAGCEAAWQAAQRGIKVRLYEMRPDSMTGAHKTDQLAELVCSNSLGSTLPDRASGILKGELKLLKSLLLESAEKAAIPAGYALAVDRELFSSIVQESLQAHPNIEILRQEVVDIPDLPCIIASGPLTSPALAESISHLTGVNNLFFYDAIAPIIQSDSINLSVAFRASRFSRDSDEPGDYINCPLSKEEYELFVTELVNAERIALLPIESQIDEGVSAGKSVYFEGCLPIEVMARRSPESLAYGPLRPIGLRDPRTGQRPHAVVQLRQDNLAATLYNLVGFQTNLTFAEQKRVFHLIPGLEHGEFVRYGQMHRNTFLLSPLVLQPSLRFRDNAHLWIAGQLSGVEGYMGNIATGALAGINAARTIMGLPEWIFPPETMLGGLCQYITSSDAKHFQPMKANLGILPPLPVFIRDKRKKAAMLADRALASMTTFLSHE